MAITTITNSMVSVNAIQGTLIADNAITAVHIATNAVSGTLIADNAVTATHIAQNTITVTQLADDAVEADKIADGVITTNHLNKAMISSQTEVTAVAGDYVLLGDTSDSNNLKKALVSDFGVAGISSSADATTITIDSSERVGIPAIGQVNVLGTQIPYLSVNGINAQNAHVNIHRHRANSLGGYLSLSKSRSDTKDFTIVQDGDELGTISFQGADGSQFQQAAQIQAEVDGTPGSADMPGRIVFLTTPDGAGTPTESMRINSNGRVSIGHTASSEAQLHVKDSTTSVWIAKLENASAGDGLLITSTTTAAAQQLFNVRGNTSTNYMKLNGRGSLCVGAHSSSGCIEPSGLNSGSYQGITFNSPNVSSPRHNYSWSNGLYWWNGSNEGSLNNAGTWTNGSDIEFKKNVADIEYGLSTVLNLQPRKYQMKIDDANDIGFIAQEMESIIPEIVHTNANNGYKSLDYGAITAVLVKAVQELKTELDAAKARIETLEG